MNPLSAAHFHNDAKAREYLESIRWHQGPVCPHCGSVKKPYELAGKSHRPGLWKCARCLQQFTVTVGTVFERSKIPLSKWLTATYRLCLSKKGISSHQLHRTLGVTYKAAWLMTRGIREAMNDGSGSLLGGPGTSGIAEADETYFGKTKGLGHSSHGSKKQKVVAPLESKGRVRAYHVLLIRAETLKPILESQVSPNTRSMTDDAGQDIKATEKFQQPETVSHTRREHMLADVTTNTVEGYFGILKCGLRATCPHTSPAHLTPCSEEFSFRYNNRTAL